MPPKKRQEISNQKLDKIKPEEKNHISQHSEPNRKSNKKVRCSNIELSQGNEEIGIKRKDDNVKPSHKIFVQDPGLDKIQCTVCQLLIYPRNKLDHILSKRHIEQIPEELGAIQELQQQRNERKARRSLEIQKKEEEEMKQEDEYGPNFIAFLSSCGISFNQIEKIISYLLTFPGIKAPQLKLEQGKAKQRVDQFGIAIKNQLLEELKCHKFSVSIDSATITGQSLAALRVRYARYWDGTIQIKNCLLSLIDLEQTSNVEKYLSIFNSELMQDEKIRSNFIGLTHDSARVFNGKIRGLVAQLKEQLDQEFLDLPDPCHVINKGIENSIQFLPNEIIDFISSITSYFHYRPQKVSSFHQVQQELEQPRKKVVSYIKLRWNSLEASFESVLQLWQSLAIFFENENNVKARQIHDLLVDEQIRIEMKYYHILLLSISCFCKGFQQKKANILQLVSNTKGLISKLLGFILKEEYKQKPVFEWQSVNFSTEQIDEYCCEYEQVLKNISKGINLDLECDSNLVQKIGKNIYDFTSNYLNYILNYLPLNNILFQNLDFLDLTIQFDELQNKISNIAASAYLIDNINQMDLVREVQNLEHCTMLQKWRSQPLTQNCQTWFEIAEIFPEIGQIVLACQSLPFSSSDTEQGFSTIKFLKNPRRNRLDVNTLLGMVLIKESFQEQNVESFKKEFVENNILTKRLIKRKRQEQSEIQISTTRENEETCSQISQQEENVEDTNQKEIDSSQEQEIVPKYIEELEYLD